MTEVEDGDSAAAANANHPATGDAARDRFPDLLPSDAEVELGTSVRSLLADRCSASSVLARTESAQTWDAALWHAVAADVGCAGLLVPERCGGAGASFPEVAVVAEELGAAVAAVPFLGSAVVATTALRRADDRHDLLARLAAGQVTAALAVPFATPPGAAFPRAVRVAGPKPGDPGQGVTRLRGQVAGVADALAADVLLVPADGVPPALYVVDAAADGVRRTPVTSLDMTRQLCDLAFDDAPARLLAAAAAAADAVAAALTAGAGMLAAEQVGLAGRCLDMTVEYVKQRRQFARPVGSFQALKHRLADRWVTLTQARAAARYAAACLAAGDADVQVAVALAKAVCGDAAVVAAQECVQMHGGIGFTWEHPAHLYLKRAQSSAVAFGTADRHRFSLADLVDLPPP